MKGLMLNITYQKTRGLMLYIRFGYKVYLMLFFSSLLYQEYLTSFPYRNLNFCAILGSSFTNLWGSLISGLQRQ